MNLSIDKGVAIRLDRQDFGMFGMVKHAQADLINDELPDVAETSPEVSRATLWEQVFSNSLP